MLKLSVALLLVALVLSASAKPPQRLAKQAWKHARTAHYARVLKRNIMSERDTPEYKKENSAEDFFENFDSEIMKLVIYGLQEFIISDIGTEHGPQIREIFNKHPQPDYTDEDSVSHYLDKVSEDIKKYTVSKGLHNPLDFSEEEDLSTNEV